MKKYVYMKVCDFKEPTYFAEKDIVQGYYDATITFATDLIVTTNHEPREIFKGEMVLVLHNNVLYARFKGENDRLYRYVKQRKYRHCSYISRDIEAQDLMPLGQTRIQQVKKMHVFEVCVTNSPRNEGTFCTVDEHHADISHVEWQENIKRVSSSEVEELIVSDEINNEIKHIQQKLKSADQTLKKIGVKEKWVN